MAFKRSAVRFRLAPPDTPKTSGFLSAGFGGFSFPGNKLSTSFGLRYIGEMFNKL